MDAGAAATLVYLRVAIWRFETVGTLAVEAILLVETGASVATGSRGTLVYLYITQRPSEAWFADTVVTVDAVLADAVVTWVAGAVIKVDLTVGP